MLSMSTQTADRLFGNFEGDLRLSEPKFREIRFDSNRGTPERKLSADMRLIYLAIWEIAKIGKFNTVWKTDSIGSVLNGRGETGEIRCGEFEKREFVGNLSMKECAGYSRFYPQFLSRMMDSIMMPQAALRQTRRG